MWREVATWRFVRHYLEMVAAMLLGMFLHPVWRAYTDGLEPSSVLRTIEVDSLAMATVMALPMVAWMVIRRHSWAAALEMAAAMYVAFLVLFPPLWGGLIGDDGVTVVGHVLMFLLMLAAMVRRRHEFGRHAHGAHAAGGPHPHGGRSIEASTDPTVGVG